MPTAHVGPAPVGYPIHSSDLECASISVLTNGRTITDDFILSLGVAGNKHRITITEKSVLVLYRRLISGQRMAVPGKGRYQHQEGGFGEVEVGDQRIHRLKGIAWVDENNHFTALDMQTHPQRPRSRMNE